MSTIIAVNKDGRTAVAADTLITAGQSTSPNVVVQPKVVRATHGLVAVSGVSVYHTLLRSYFAKNESAGFTSEADVLDTFILLWKFLREHYHFVNDQADTDDPTPFADLAAQFIVASRSGLFVVREILSVSRYERFCAIGSGDNHAEGAAAVLYGQQLSASEIARQAVEIACQFNRRSGGEIQVYELDES